MFPCLLFGTRHVSPRPNITLNPKQLNISSLNLNCNMYYCSSVLKLSSKQDVRGTKIETPATATTQVKTQANVSLKQDNVTIKGLQANVTIPKVINSLTQ